MASVNVIKKITKAMKMVAAARVKRSQDALEHARRFVAPMESVWPDPDTKGDTKESKGNYGLVAVTADRGLCGAVNNSIVREVKSRLNTDSTYRPAIITIGEKCRSGLDRIWGSLFLLNINDQVKLKRMTFRNCSEVADLILTQPLDSGVFLYNKFKNLLSYYPVTAPFLSMKRALETTTLSTDYELEGPDDMLENLHAFRMATRIYYIMAEQDTCELSSRMNAMGNSSKNASEVIERLQLRINRTRQARITTELCEIIGGMEGLKAKE
jgi:ATP synthase F1 gamma subunit